MLPQQVRGHVDNPYVGILVFLVLPALFFTGLALVPIGVYLTKRQIRRGLSGEGFDRQAALRRIAWFFGATTLLNILVGTQVSYRAVKYMETPQFCGGSRHTMNAELAAHQNSPQSRVECVECHVAPGAAGWISAKTNRVRQLFETVLIQARDQFRPVWQGNLKVSRGIWPLPLIRCNTMPHGKALSLDLDSSIYGTLTEISRKSLAGSLLSARR